MSATKFTPGPWRRVGHRQIASANGACLPICEVWSGGVGIEQADANECLIAAAPDLVEALQDFVRLVDAFGPNSELGRACAKYRLAANTAIAKALGDQA